MYSFYFNPKSAWKSYIPLFWQFNGSGLANRYEKIGQDARNTLEARKI